MAALATAVSAVPVLEERQSNAYSDYLFAYVSCDIFVFLNLTTLRTLHDLQRRRKNINHLADQHKKLIDSP